jgi:23S rRNA-/tRNA-specific pseudouridylate synthase
MLLYCAGMVVHPAVGSPNGTFVNALLFHVGPEGRRLLDDRSQMGYRPIFPDGLQMGGDTHHDYCNDEDGLLDGDVLRDMDLDLPETPEAANASPTFLRPGIVHRLDKGTSGVLIAGRS